MEATPNPADDTQTLKRPLESEGQLEHAHPPQPIFPEDSALTKAEKVERNNASTTGADTDEPSTKRQRLDNEEVDQPATVTYKADTRENKGITMIKAEYLIDQPSIRLSGTEARAAYDDDASEARPRDDRDNPNGGGKKGKGKREKKEGGQNHSRQFGSSRDAITLCNSRANTDEFSPKDCRFGDRCNMSHDLRKYLADGKRDELTTLGGTCPVWKIHGKCFSGWKCRYVSSHMEEVTLDDGRKELRLTFDPTKVSSAQFDENESNPGVVNVASTEQKLGLAKRKTKTDRSDKYADWMDKEAKELEKFYYKKGKSEQLDHVATFTEPPFLPSEKRRIYYGPETPTLAPLTTQGNLPFRRLCIELGAQITFSEMALAQPLIQGQKGEWALMKAHERELVPPMFNPRPNSVVEGYDNSKDLRFGAQISASKPWQAMKAAEVMSHMLPHLRVIDLNCGCPIDLVYRAGAGSALLEAPSKLEKIVRGMNAVSGEIPITAKIRMGSKQDKPIATKLIERLAFGGVELSERLGAPGCAAITLHGRSRQQRYSRSADWSYIAQCSAQIKAYHDKKDDLTDTIRESDERYLANGSRLYFLGNGDCYSYERYNQNIQQGGVDSVMIARGALIKPWIFEEVQSQQYLDKSATERLGYVEKFVRNGLEAWGSDEIGVGQTRRFLLEWLSFACRYVPVGILERLPPSMNDRPPAFRGRNELETLLSSDNYLDWIKISEMFLGPAHKDFKFLPKHKSNSYEIEAEG